MHHNMTIIEIIFSIEASDKLKFDGSNSKFDIVNSISIIANTLLSNVLHFAGLLQLTNERSKHLSCPKSDVFEKE